MRTARAAALLTVVACCAWPAAAQTDPNAAAKPLNLAPSEHKQKPKQGDLPQEFIDLREKMKGEFNDWMKENQEIQKACDASRSVADRISCEVKQKASQDRLNAVHAHTRDMLRQIDNWRRKQAGLPPPPWWGDENKAAGQADNGNRDLHPPPPPPPPKQKPDTSVLLPQQGTTLPANTF